MFSPLPEWIFNCWTQFSTSGVEFDSESVRVAIPANSIHQVILSGKALQSGVLTIRGCIVQALGGVPREYILPLYSNEEEQKHLRKRSLQACEAGRPKHPGLASFAGVKERKLNVTQGIIEQSNITSFRFLECKVVPEQPLLRIRRTSVTHGALMLYDGERHLFFEYGKLPVADGFSIALRFG